MKTKLLTTGGGCTYLTIFTFDIDDAQMVENVLMHELQEVKMEVEAHNPTQKLQEVKREVEEGSHSVSILMSDNVATTTCTSQEQSALKTCVNKRKRGERKAGSGGWNMKSPGEPDNQ